MDPKKKTVWENFRQKAKPLFGKKGKKEKLGKSPKPLAHRRSISVPDLRFVQQKEPSPTVSEEVSTDSDTYSFGKSSFYSDSGSFSNGSGPLFADKLTVTDSAPPQLPSRQAVPDSASPQLPSRQAVPDSALLDNMALPGYRMSVPVEILTLYEEAEEMAEDRVNMPTDGVNVDVDKQTTSVERVNVAVPKPRSTPSNTLMPTPELTPPLVEKVNIPPPEPRPTSFTECPTTSSSEHLNKAARKLATPRDRAFSSGDQINLFREKLATSSERKRLPGDRWTPPVTRANIPDDRWSLPTEGQGTPGESADNSSMDSTPWEERPNMAWPIDSEDLEMREPLSPHISEIFCMEPEEDMNEISNEEESDLYAMPMQDQAGSSAMAAGDELPAPVIPWQKFLLTINLKEGKNLVVRDRNGFSDPYCKFKLEGKTFYKSKVVNKNLNPRWNESFSFPLRDREQAVDLRVYDKNLTTDCFMGSTTIVVKNTEIDKTCEMVLPLGDPNSLEGDMGVIVIDICLTFRDATIKKRNNLQKWLPKKKRSFKGGQLNQNQNQAQAQVKGPSEALKKTQLWGGVFGITLVEGQDLPEQGHGDVYVRFRLGEQKYRSKNLCVQANPQWRERFDFNQFEDGQDEPLQVEVFVKRGRKSEESWGLFEIDLSRMPVDQQHLYTHVLDPGKGRLVFLVTLTPCTGASVSDIHNSPLEQTDEKDRILDKYGLKNSLKSMREVGFLQVKVIKATDLLSTDLNGKSDPFCVLELGNSRLQTQTIYKTLNPAWNKVLTFPIKDIHEVLELTVFDEDGDKAADFLGRVAIPLLSVTNGQQICRVLKKEDLGGPSKGTITLAMEVLYNPVRAGIRTFRPKETKFMEDSPKFSKKILAQNIYRVRRISTAVLYTLQYIKSCFQWESTQRSIIAFLIFSVTVWTWELFMLPLFLLLLIGWNYFQLSSGRISSNQDLVNMTMTDDEEEDEKEAGKKGLMEKIHMVQEIVITVQTIMDEIASMGERIKNTFNWSVPFMSWLACLVLFVATVVVYYIPLRYILLAWGFNKFTKKLRNPYAIDNNEILDFLKRVPSDVQKVQYSELRAPAAQGPPRRRR